MWLHTLQTGKRIALWDRLGRMQLVEGPKLIRYRNPDKLLRIEGGNARVHVHEHEHEREHAG